MSNRNVEGMNLLKDRRYIVREQIFDMTFIHMKISAIQDIKNLIINGLWR